MTRVALLLGIVVAMAGCGGAERPQFTPAGAETAPSTAREPVKASREVAIPRNIETH